MTRNLLTIVLLTLSAIPAGAQCAGLQPRVATPATVEEEERSTGTVARQAAMLLKGDFDSIDFLANRLRTRKIHLPNGNWSLNRFYNELNPPKSQAGSTRYLQQLNAWVAANPNSIAAHIALARFYHQWASDARGTGTACTVSPQQWKLYEDRSAKAHQILDEAAGLKPMDPEWFSTMQTIAFAEEWPRPKMQELFDRATALAPDYFPFYRSYARYLLPKWYGHAGDAEAFATQAADKLSGDAGDIVYFHISAEILSGGKEQFDLKKMDWPRIQRGYLAHLAAYGDSPTHENEYAWMAFQFKDAVEARKAFALIGDRWGQNVWRHRQTFDQAKNWAGAAVTDGGAPARF